VIASFCSVSVSALIDLHVFCVTAVAEHATEDSKSEVMCDARKGKKNGFLTYSCNLFSH